MEDMEEELVDIANLSVLGNDEVRLEMQLIPTNDKNYPAPENTTEIKNQGEVVYNSYWGHGGI